MYHYHIQVDAGIVPGTSIRLLVAGANVFVAGSYIYDADEPAVQINALKEALQ